MFNLFVNSLLLVILSRYSSAVTPCPRFNPGSVVTSGPVQQSFLGRLYTQVNYRGGLDANGVGRNCFMINDFEQSPTLRVNPGDVIFFTVTNQFAGYVGEPTEVVNTTYYAICGSQRKTPSSVNVHFHGLHSPPQCHGDEVVRTIINYGETFTYYIQIPTNQPPGIYWYHPHIHMFTERAVKGGATGAIIVNGIINYKPQLIGLREQFFVIRDFDADVGETDDPTVPNFDLSINYVPITYPDNIPAIIEMKPGETQFWRIVNTASTTILNLTFTYDNVLQPYTIVSIDATPLTVDRVVTSYVFGPGSRIEFTIKAPTNPSQYAIMSTQTFFTGPDGDKDVYKPLARIRITPYALSSGYIMSYPTFSTILKTPANLLAMTPVTNRTLYFSQIDDEITEETTFFITEEGSIPTAYSRAHAPAITATQGTIEDWIIENRAGEAHVFHIHQIRFLVIAINGIPLSYNDMTFQDVVTIPYWSKELTDPYPSVTIRLDFTANWIVGDFMYHCHILEHEDKGMMQVLHINPPPNSL